MRYCDECKHLSPKEHEQTKLRPLHWCDAYSKPVFHNGYHPRIPTPYYCIINKDNKHFNFRKWLSVKLVKLASKLYPKNPDVMKFYQQMMMDIAIMGTSITRVDINDYYKKEKQ